MRWVSDPMNYGLLADFACGGDSGYEQQVEDLLDQLRDMSAEDAAEYKIRVAEARHTDDLIAISVFHERQLGEAEEFADAVYLALAAVNQPYRGWRMPDGATRIGTFLLCDTLAQVDRLWGDPMRCVWALVHQDNKDCHNVLTRHSFWRLRDVHRDPSDQPYYVYLRQKGLDWAFGFSAQILDAVERASQ
jgi:hypothetical protein